MPPDPLILHRFAPLIRGRLLRRYKRFLADVRLEDGSEVTVHCPNPGRMSSILPDPEAIFLTDLKPQLNPKRKLDFRWELAQVQGTLVMVNTQLANLVAGNLLAEDSIARQKLGLKHLQSMSREVTVPASGGSNSRFDFAFTDDSGETLYLEVKQVSLRVKDAGGKRWAAFPDAVSARARRHLEELTAMTKAGISTALLYIVGRSDVDAVRPAWEVDPRYAEAYGRAMESGVKVLACQIDVRVDQLRFARWLPTLNSFTG